jgi:hypothetical protein
MSTGKSSSIKHENNAERFMLFVDGLNTIAGTYTRDVPMKQPQNDYPLEKQGKCYLSTHLSYVIQKSSEKKDKCWISTLIDGSVDGNPRIAIPSTIVKALSAANVQWGKNVARPKVPVTWVICWLYDIYPGKLENWEKFEVSHRCRNNTCVTPKHLCWETKSQNQSRGNDFCRRKCTHSTCQSRCVCECQAFHNPCCL